MSRPELINQLKEKHPQLNKSQLETIIDVFFDSIKRALERKKTVELRMFGTFFVKEIKEKFYSRNPKTGEIIYVPKKKKLDSGLVKSFKNF